MTDDSIQLGDYLMQYAAVEVNATVCLRSMPCSVDQDDARD